MHHCLLIPELALYIIHFLADDRPAWHDSRYLRNPKDVARLARTCKALAEPALDVLWQTQHSLAPLMMCLSPDVWELTKRGKAIVRRAHCPYPEPCADVCPPCFGCRLSRETPRLLTGPLSRNTLTVSSTSLNPRRLTFPDSMIPP